MKRKFLFLALTLAVCLGLAPTAFAAGETEIDLGNGLTAKLSEPILGTREITGAIEDETGELTSPTVTAYVVSETTEFEFVGRYDFAAGSDCLAWIADYGEWGYNGPLYIDDKELYEGTENGAEEYARRRFRHFSPGMYATITFPEDWEGWESQFSRRTTQTYFVVEKSGSAAENPAPTPPPASVPGYVTKEGLSILFTEGNFNDFGITYTIQITNTSDQNITGVYSLLSYSNLNSGQFLCFDVNLAPGESVTESRSSGFYALSHYNMIWMSFNDIQERSEFLKNAPVYVVGGTLDCDWQEGFFANDYGMPLYFVLDFMKAPDFLRDTFGIE